MLMNKSSVFVDKFRVTLDWKRVGVLAEYCPFSRCLHYSSKCYLCKLSTSTYHYMPTALDVRQARTEMSGGRPCTQPTPLLKDTHHTRQSPWVETVPELKQGRSHGVSEGTNSVWSFLSDARFAHATCHCFNSGIGSTQGLCLVPTLSARLKSLKLYS